MRLPEVNFIENKRLKHDLPALVLVEARHSPFTDA